jgi:hypothetical protein
VYRLGEHSARELVSHRHQQVSDPFTFCTTIEGDIIWPSLFPFYVAKCPTLAEPFPVFGCAMFQQLGVCCVPNSMLLLRVTDTDTTYVPTNFSQ